jgi:hypothetical protein
MKVKIECYLNNQPYEFERELPGVDRNLLEEIVQQALIETFNMQPNEDDVYDLLIFNILKKIETYKKRYKGLLGKIKALFGNDKKKTYIISLPFDYLQEVLKDFSRNSSNFEVPSILKEANERIQIFEESIKENLIPNLELKEI